MVKVKSMDTIMHHYHVQKSQFHGDIHLPSSKSQSIRALLFASLAQGESHIKNLLPSPDILAMLSACKACGATIEYENNCAHIIGTNGKIKTPDNIIDAGNSGQVLRFIACLAGLQNHYLVITGDASIRNNRPIKPLLEALPQLGMTCLCLREDDHAPLILKGPFTQHRTTLSGEDSQPVSGLLMALAFHPGTHEIQVRNPGELPWINLTLSWLSRFQIDYTHRDFMHYQITGKEIIPAFDYTVPGDLSSLAYPLVAAILTQSTLCIYNVDLTEPQGDKAIIDVLKKMGAHINIDQNKKTLTVHPSGELQGIEIDINDFIDCITILAVVGCFAKGKTKIIGAKIARLKESDRIAAITQELRKMGAHIEEFDDGLTIYKSVLHGATVESHHDHRIAMSLAVAGFASPGETPIRNIDCVQKSFPNFLESMQTIGGKICVSTS
jgi:3-phosphoshikimate 1-carboxyvinyltransferase